MAEGNKQTWAMWYDKDHEEPSLDVLNIKDNATGVRIIPIEQSAREHSRENTRANTLPARSTEIYPTNVQEALETKEGEEIPGFGLEGAWKKKIIKDMELKSSLESFDWSIDESQQSQSLASNWTANEDTKYLSDQSVWRSKPTNNLAQGFAPVDVSSAPTETKVKEAEESDRPGFWREKSIIQYASVNPSSSAPRKTKEVEAEESERHLSWRKNSIMWGMQEKTLPGRYDTQESQSLIPRHRSDNEHTKNLAHLPTWRRRTRECDFLRMRESSSFVPMETKEENAAESGMPGSWRKKNNMIREMRHKNILPSFCRSKVETLTQESNEDTKYLAYWSNSQKKEPSHKYDLSQGFASEGPLSSAPMKSKKDEAVESEQSQSWGDMQLETPRPVDWSCPETRSVQETDPRRSQIHEDTKYLADWPTSQNVPEDNKYVSQGFASEDPLSSALMENKEAEESERPRNDMQLATPSVDWSFRDTEIQETVDSRPSQTDENTKNWSDWPIYQNDSTDLSADLSQSLALKETLSAPNEAELESSESWSDLRLKSIMSCIDCSIDDNQDPIYPRTSQANENLEYLVDRRILHNEQIESQTYLPQSVVPADPLSTDLMETVEEQAEESKLSGSINKKNINLICEVQINSASTFTWTILDTQTPTQKARLNPQHWAKKPFRKMVKEREAKSKPVVPTKDPPKTTPQDLETEKKIVGLGIKSWKKGLVIKEVGAKIESNIALIDVPKKDSQSVTCVTSLPTSCKAIDVPLPAWEQDSSELETPLPVMPVCRYRIPNKIAGHTIRNTKIEIVANYLPVVVKPIQILRYSVTFQPEKPKIICDNAFKLIKRKYFPKQLTAFDQRQFLFCLKPLQIPGASDDGFSKKVNVVGYRDRQMAVNVSIKTAGRIDLNSLIQYMKTDGSSMAQPVETIQAVDIILRQGNLESFIKSGRKFYKRPSNPIDLGHGMEIWTGLFQSAIFTSAAFVNVDVSHKGFPKAKHLTDLLVSDFQLDLNQPLERQNKTKVDSFKNFVSGLRVSLDYTRKNPSSQSKSIKNDYYCNDIVNVPAKQYFNLECGNIVLSVAEYYAKFEKYSIKYPNLNCIWVGPRNKSIYWPIELVHVPSDQVIYKPFNDNQMAIMSRGTTPAATERKRKIEEILSHMNYSKTKMFKKFGLEIDDKLLSISAKLLEPPHLDVGDKQPIIPNNGSWIAKRFLKAGTLQSWAFIALEPNITCDINAFLSMVIDTGKCMGMLISKPDFVISNVNLQQFSSTEFKQKIMGLRLLMILISDSVENQYQKVKTIAERELGIVTQCVRGVTLLKPHNEMTSVVRNLMLKINSKLMGINQTLNRSSLPKCLVNGGVMIVGADVTHPSHLQTDPSIAAITATIDAATSYFSYNIELSVQTPKKEIIVEFEDMMVDHLMVYKNKNGTLPKKIYVFRDGVSDGELAQVMNYELSAVYLAYQRMTGTVVKPEVLFVVVQKRHHTRFFSSRDYQNVVPGTVVDTHIVHGNELDFYMVSHQPLRGTAKPTRYRVVCNDGRIPADEIEQLTYYLCHLYARCMRAVSYPTPTYYAHLACIRARALTYNDVFANLEEMPQRLRIVKKLLEQSRMFFV